MDRKFAVFGAAVLGATSWYLISPIFDSSRAEDVFPNGQVIAHGEFRPAFHSVRGRAILLSSSDGEILHFEDFKTINGPGLHVYLAFGPDTTDFYDVGAVRATSGEINYVIPASIDTRRYRYVLIWSEALRTLFSYAELR